MKKAFVYLLFFSGLISLFSCEDTDYQIYDKNQKDKLFFPEDSVQFTYGLTRDQDVDLNLEVNLIGFVDLSQNKTFKVEIVKEKTTALEGEHFTLAEENTIPKDSAVAYVPLDFHKLQLEKNKEYVLTLRLVENENYVPTDIKECIILFSNKDIEAPVWWQSGKLGEYNQEKLILFVDFYHQSKEKSPVIYELIRKTWGENLDQGTATNLLTIYRYQGYLKRYILTPMYEYYLESNDPMYQIPNPNN